MLNNRQNWEEARTSTRRMAVGGLVIAIMSAGIWIIIPAQFQELFVVKMLVGSGFVVGLIATACCGWFQHVITRDHLQE